MERRELEERLCDVVYTSDVINQTKEECAEMIVALSHLLRNIGQTNPVRMSREQAVQNILEETADVMNCIELLKRKLPCWDEYKVEEIRNAKLIRWLNECSM